MTVVRLMSLNLICQFWATKRWGFRDAWYIPSYLEHSSSQPTGLVMLMWYKALVMLPSYGVEQGHVGQLRNSKRGSHFRWGECFFEFWCSKLDQSKPWCIYVHFQFVTDRTRVRDPIETLAITLRRSSECCLYQSEKLLLFGGQGFGDENIWEMRTKAGGESSKVTQSQGVQIHTPILINGNEWNCSIHTTISIWY